ncbi:MAG: alanine/glycine:cation symporter family protein, partial [Acinetobacter radioresistens]
MDEQLNTRLMAWVSFFNDPLWDFLVVFLVVVGVFYTLLTGAVQIRLFLHSIRVMKGSRKEGDDQHGITPFQAFVTGLASRVGVGNVAGVAIAIAIGGPGAVFWMWFTAFLGMSSAFVESSLAQLFKVRDHQNQQFRGGPAYYITQGLKQKWLGVVFALSLILAYGFVFNAVQANSIVDATAHAWGWDRANVMLDLGGLGFEVSWVGVVLVIMTAAIIFGGIKRIAVVAERMVPLMAVLYLAVALYIAIINFSILPDIFKLIFTEAFKFDA